MPVYVITGANRGLGLEFATQISQDTSNTIIGTTRTLTSDLSEFNVLKAHNKNIHILECDTGSILSIQAFAKQLSKLLGDDNGNKIDFLLNNAGINSVPHETSTSISEQGIEDQIRINFLGPAKTVEFLDAAGLLGKGSVVMNMTSGLGSVALAKENNMAKCTTYSISKAALNMLTVHQSVEFKEKGVVIICMDPGWVKTRMGGEGAVLEKEFSIGGMLKVIRGVGEADTGKFFEYSGKERPW